MDIMQSFMAYAGDFERAYLDDDWTRLLPHFAADAVYEVQAPVFGCRLQGPEAIVAGMRKSVNGFDRRFDRRDIAVTSGPDIAGDELRVSWTATYSSPGVEPFVLRGRSIVRGRDGRITELVDAYEPQVAQELAEWQRANGMALDVSYA